MKKKNKHSFGWWLHKSHRYIGVASSMILFMLAVTGIALNHTEDLKLDSRFVQNKSLLNWYGIVAPDPSQVFKTANYYLTQIKQQIYLNQQFIFNTPEILQGAVETKDFIALALENSIVLLSSEGEIIEKIEQSGLKEIGINYQHIFIKQAGNILVSKDGLLTWKITDATQIQWSKSTQLPKPIARVIKQKFRGSILPLERVFLDIHSGRFFGKLGVIIVDICGVLLILLVFSGVNMWLKYRR